MMVIEALRTNEEDRIAELERELAVARKDAERLAWLLDDYRRVDLYNSIGTMSRDLDTCRAAIDEAMAANPLVP